LLNRLGNDYHSPHDLIDGFVFVYTASTAKLVNRPGCRVSVAHTQVTCTSAPGSGQGHHWTFTVPAQAAVLATNAQHVQWTGAGNAGTAYAVPVLSGVGGQGAHEASTEGGQVIVLTGASFGPPTSAEGGASPVVVVYGPKSTDAGTSDTSESGVTR